MRIVFILPVVALLISGFAYFSVDASQHGFIRSPLNSGGASPGMTGAPNESNCTQCHSGSVQNGETENLLTILNGSTPVSMYIPGQQYTVNLSMSSNPTKRGFQATALTTTNTMAGGFTGQAGNTSINGGAKKYANHTSSSNTSSNAPSWTWTWTAPAVGSGPVTFYVATNKTNNNGNNNGDMIYLSQHVIQEESGNGVLEGDEQVLQLVQITSERITFKVPKNVGQVNGITIFNATGKMVSSIPYLKVINNEIVIDRTSNIESGLFFISMGINNSLYTKKIVLQ
ncbi:MAG: hypothetical protein RL365_13 [Bacteroidota bacterium]|jgi:hypothetical protein